MDITKSAYKEDPIVYVPPEAGLFFGLLILVSFVIIGMICVQRRNKSRDGDESVISGENMSTRTGESMESSYVYEDNDGSVKNSRSGYELNWFEKMSGCCACGRKKKFSINSLPSVNEYEIVVEKLALRKVPLRVEIPDDRGDKPSKACTKKGKAPPQRSEMPCCKTAYLSTYYAEMPVGPSTSTLMNEHERQETRPIPKTKQKGSYFAIIPGKEMPSKYSATDSSASELLPDKTPTEATKMPYVPNQETYYAFPTSEGEFGDHHQYPKSSQDLSEPKDSYVDFIPKGSKGKSSYSNTLASVPEKYSDETLFYPPRSQESNEKSFIPMAGQVSQSCFMTLPVYNECKELPQYAASSLESEDSAVAYIPQNSRRKSSLNSSTFISLPQSHSKESENHIFKSQQETYYTSQEVVMPIDESNSSSELDLYLYKQNENALAENVSYFATIPQNYTDSLQPYTLKNEENLSREAYLSQNEMDNKQPFTTKKDTTSFMALISDNPPDSSASSADQEVPAEGKVETKPTKEKGKKRTLNTVICYPVMQQNITPFKPKTPALISSPLSPQVGSIDAAGTEKFKSQNLDHNTASQSGTESNYPFNDKSWPQNKSEETVSHTAQNTESRADQYDNNAPTASKAHTQYTITETSKPILTKIPEVTSDKNVEISEPIPERIQTFSYMPQDNEKLSINPHTKTKHHALDPEETRILQSIPSKMSRLGVNFQSDPHIISNLYPDNCNAEAQSLVVDSKTLPSYYTIVPPIKITPLIAKLSKIKVNKRKIQHQNNPSDEQSSASDNAEEVDQSVRFPSYYTFKPVSSEANIYAFSSEHLSPHISKVRKPSDVLQEDYEDNLSSSSEETVTYVAFSTEEKSPAKKQVTREYANQFVNILVERNDKEPIPKDPFARGHALFDNIPNSKKKKFFHKNVSAVMSTRVPTLPQASVTVSNTGTGTGMISHHTQTIDAFVKPQVSSRSSMKSLSPRISKYLICNESSSNIWINKDSAKPSNTNLERYDGQNRDLGSDVCLPLSVHYLSTAKSDQLEKKGEQSSCGNDNRISLSWVPDTFKNQPFVYSAHSSPSKKSTTSSKGTQGNNEINTSPLEGNSNLDNNTEGSHDKSKSKIFKKITSEVQFQLKAEPFSSKDSRQSISKSRKSTDLTSDMQLPSTHSTKSRASRKGGTQKVLSTENNTTVNYSISGSPLLSNRTQETQKDTNAQEMVLDDCSFCVNLDLISSPTLGAKSRIGSNKGKNHDDTSNEINCTVIDSTSDSSNTSEGPQQTYEPSEPQEIGCVDLRNKSQGSSVQSIPKSMKSPSLKSQINVASIHSTKLKAKGNIHQDMSSTELCCSMISDSSDVKHRNEEVSGEPQSNAAQSNVLTRESKSKNIKPGTDTYVLRYAEESRQNQSKYNIQDNSVRSIKSNQQSQEICCHILQKSDQFIETDIENITDHGHHRISAGSYIANRKKSIETGCQNLSDVPSSRMSGHLYLDNRKQSIETACLNLSDVSSSRMAGNLYLDNRKQSIETACLNLSDVSSSKMSANLYLDNRKQSIETACQNLAGVTSSRIPADLYLDNRKKSIETGCQNLSDTASNRMAGSHSVGIYKCETPTDNAQDRIFGTPYVSNRLQSIEIGCENLEDALPYIYRNDNMPEELGCQNVYRSSSQEKSKMHIPNSNSTIGLNPSITSKIPDTTVYTTSVNTKSHHVTIMSPLEDDETVTSGTAKTGRETLSQTDYTTSQTSSSQVLSERPQTSSASNISLTEQPETDISVTDCEVSKGTTLRWKILIKHHRDATDDHSSTNNSRALTETEDESKKQSSEDLQCTKSSTDSQMEDTS